MADPVSIAGFAVGVLSLGFQTLQCVVKYCHAVKGRAEEVRAVLECAEREQRYLALLQRRFPMIATQPTADIAQIRYCLDQAETAFLNLDQHIQKVRQGPPTGIRDKGCDVLRKVIYPFQKEVVKELKDHLEIIGRILMEAAQLLHLQVKIGYKA